MNQVIITQKEIKNNAIKLNATDHRFLHIAKVLKLNTGNTLNLCVLNTARYKGVIKEINTNSCVLSLSQKLPSHHLRNYLLIGLSRPIVMKRILEIAATLGFKNIWCLKSEKGEKSYLNSKLWVDQTYVKNLSKGIEQSKIFHELPQVKMLRSIEKLQNLIPRKNPLFHCFAFDPSGINPSKSLASKKIDQEILMAIGPERGWSSRELEFFNSLDFNTVQLTSSILKVETALVYAKALVDQIL